MPQAAVAEQFTAKEMLEKAIAAYDVGDEVAMEEWIRRYEERRKDGGFKPMIEIDGDKLKSILVNLFHVQQELKEHGEPR